VALAPSIQWVLDERDGVLGAVLHQLAQHAEELALLQIGVDVRHRMVGVGHAEELEQNRQHLAIAVVQREHMTGELLACAAVRVLLSDAVVMAKDLQDRQQGDIPAVRRAAPLDDAHADGAAVLGELIAQSAFAGPRFGDDTDHLSVAGTGARQRRLQDIHLGGAADEARQTAGLCDLEARAQCAGALELEYADRFRNTLDLGAAEILELEISVDEPRRVFGETNVPGAGKSLHALRQTDDVSLRRVVHPQVVADLSDDHFAGIHAHADRQVDAVRAAEFVGVVA
jgi:hypothetical protein